MRWLNGSRFAPVVEVVSDPAGLFDAMLDMREALDHGGRQRSGWFERMAKGTEPTRVTQEGQTVLYRDRACCTEHLTQVEYVLPRVRLPYETTCAFCKRTFRIKVAPS